MISRRWVEYGPPNYPFVLNRESPQAKGLVSWWPASASHGAAVMKNLAIATRSSDGVINFSISAWGNLAEGPALVMDSAPAINLGTGAEVFGQHYTLSLWIGLSVLPTVNFSLGDKRQSGGGAGWRLGFRTSNQIRFTHFGASPSLVDFNTFLAVGVHHYIFVYNNNSNTMSLYRDGKFRSSRSLGTNLSSSANGTISGSIDSPQFLDMRFYDRILTPIEVYQLYAPQTRWELYQPVQRASLAFVAAAGLGPVYPGRNHPSRNVLLRL